jgi:putative ATP-dependent endonuclease of OLD family
MYLEKFTIKNFRTIENLTLTFNKGLNILIGENNSGKTAIIDSLRICLGYGNLRKDIYIKDTDFHFQKNNVSDSASEIEFHLFFKIEIFQEAAWFYDLLCSNEDKTLQDLQLHLRFFIDENSGTKKIKYRVWGGANEGQQITPDVLSLLYHVHLDALRDAEQHLRPVRGNKLGQLYNSIQIDMTSKDADKQKKQALADRVHTAVHSDLEWKDHLAKGKEKINEHLKETSFSGEELNVDVDFLSYDFNKLVENLKIQMPLYNESILNGSKQKYFEMHQNGLGYNNLIYTATVLGDLYQKKELEIETYAALLIEEPEAHLHPQLQNLFFNYLNKLDKERGFQLFVTSHSPTITAKADLKSVIILQSEQNSINSLAIRDSGLSAQNLIYLEKFLDVTKSQLFFSNGVMLVEGISEALLMKIFSIKVGDTYNIEKAGVEIVNIGGVAFEHFASLFNNTETTKNLKIRCSLITDDDRKEILDNPAKRIAKINKMQGGTLKAFIAAITFEYELFLASEKNRIILLNIYKEFHPQTEIGRGANAQEYSKYFADIIKKQKSKSELALRLATHLENGYEISKLLTMYTNYSFVKKQLQNMTKENKFDYRAYRDFVVPPYIQKAIKYAVKNEFDV